MRILFADDERAMTEAVADILNFHQYETVTVFNGVDALKRLEEESFDGAILDIMMPGLSGLEVLRALRENGNTLPVMLLTAKSEIEDKVAGFDLGADDYLTKPFAMAELLARVKALVRHGGAASDNPVAGNVTLDTRRMTLSTQGGTVTLSRLEYRLIELFLTHPGQVFSAEALLSRVWGIDSEAEIGTVWVYISYLRKKLVSLKANAYIRSKRGLGYYLEAEK